MATWGSDTALTQITSVTDTEQFSDAVTLSNGEACHVQVEVNFVASPTDDMQVSVYTTLDASTENWDDVAFMTFIVDNGTDPSAVAFVIPSGIYKFRLGVAATGSTDTHTSVDISYRTLAY